MTYKELEQLHRGTCDAARDIMKRKNHDYTDGSVDPFANFRAAEVLDLDPVVGVLLRMQDKIMRLKTFANKGKLDVANESATDAVTDIINYAILILGLVRENEKPSPHTRHDG